MIQAGFKDQVAGAEALVPLDVITGPGAPLMKRTVRPEQLPRLPDGHMLFGTRDQGFGEVLYLCEMLEDAQYLWDSQDTALASPHWYSAPVMFAEDN